VATFLDKAKSPFRAGVTRTALCLLGKPEASPLPAGTGANYLENCVGEEQGLRALRAALAAPQQPLKVPCHRIRNIRLQALSRRRIQLLATEVR